MIENPRTNAELLAAFEEVCFELIRRPTKDCWEITKRFNDLEQRMANCMCISDYDMQKIREGKF